MVTLHNGVMDKKVLIINDQQDMGHPYYPAFSFIGAEIQDPEWLDGDPQSIALVVFTGGSDVQPSLYGENTNPRCHCKPQRDAQEVEVFKKALAHGIPMFGICRGAQFLCVMSGGKLVQHTTGHHRTHSITLADGRRFDVSSSHHQMMIPKEGDVVLGWAEPKLSHCYQGGNGEELNYNREVEVVEFPSIKAYGVQYHPEVMAHDTDGFKYCNELIRKLL